MIAIETKNLKKIYDPYSAYPKVALHNINMTVEKGDFICVMGPSGSGKTTLINLLSTIDTCTSGKVTIFNQDISIMSEKEKALFRKHQIGFIFQNYNLIDSLTCKDNILFSMRLHGVSKEIQQTTLQEVTRQLNIEDILNKYPFECSGGQQQRVAIARATIMKPSIIFADEPTGNLDSLHSKELMELLTKINIEHRTTIVMVTHDNLIASYSSKLLYMKDGTITKTISKSNTSQEEYYNKIIKITC